LCPAVYQQLAGRNKTGSPVVGGLIDRRIVLQTDGIHLYWIQGFGICRFQAQCCRISCAAQLSAPNPLHFNRIDFSFSNRPIGSFTEAADKSLPAGIPGW
jgi:hypothetical protein